jgi:hypothetical protein
LAQVQGLAPVQTSEQVLARARVLMLRQDAGWLR